MVVVDFINRVSSYPVVNSAYSQANSYYSWAKEQNKLIRSAAQLTENGLMKMVGTAQPLLDRFDNRIHSLDELACQQLDRLEHRYPVMNEPTDKVVDKTVQFYQSSVKPSVEFVLTPVTATVQTVSRIKTSTRQYSIEKYRQIVESRYGQAGLQKVDELLNTLDQQLEHYLPEEKKKEEQKDQEEEETENCDDESRAHRAVVISDKLRRRLYSRAVRQWIRFREAETRLSDEVRKDFWIRVERREENEQEICQIQHSALLFCWQKVRIYSAASADVTVDRLHPLVVRVRTSSGVRELRTTWEQLVRTIENNSIVHSMLVYVQNLTKTSSSDKSTSTSNESSRSNSVENDHEHESKNTESSTAAEIQETGASTEDVPEEDVDESTTESEVTSSNDNAALQISASLDNSNLSLNADISVNVP